MNDAIDMLRPKAREALERLGYFLTGTHNHNDFYAIRTELLRLAEIENERWNVVATRNAAIERAERAEAKLDALMLEYCAEEMTEEQLVRYEKHQVRSDDE